ncbi:MAG TPA: efflux RND transporter periplasmic adaptor subunit [Nevskiaceae bacterium]|nr:efflux RND transporter periplasmic adaptor subunit [Nevskiaceae bacterium]
MKGAWKLVLLVAGIGGIAALVWARSHSDGKPRGGERPPVEAEMTTVRVGPAPVAFVAVGQVQSPHAVAIRPQVGGTLVAVHFTEGADVAAGALLAQIDPAPYRAAVAQAKAVLERDRAAAAVAKSSLDRLLPLAEKDYASPQEIENARSTHAQALAVVASDEAALARAQLDLDHTRIVAPIAGRTGSLSVKPGNLVETTDANPLVTINQLRPIEVSFAAPQSRLGAVREALARGAVPVSIATEDGRTKLDEGRLVFVDNTVDGVTGTVRLKAESPNAAQTLWPGSFVTVTVTLAMQNDALLVPESAVQAGADGPYVFRVGEDGKVALATVAVDRQSGDDVVVTKGVSAGERIVLKAPRNLLPGAQVVPPGTRSAAPGGESGERRAGPKP